MHVHVCMYLHERVEQHSTKRSKNHGSDTSPTHSDPRRHRTLAFEEGSSAYREQAQLLKQEGVRFDGLKIIEVETDDSLDRILWGPQD